MQQRGRKGGGYRSRLAAGNPAQQTLGEVEARQAGPDELKDHLHGPKETSSVSTPLKPSLLPAVTGQMGGREEVQIETQQSCSVFCVPRFGNEEDSAVLPHQPFPSTIHPKPVPSKI